MKKVVYSFQLGDMSDALKHCDQAIALLRPHAGEKASPYFLFKEATAYGARASILRATSDLKKVISSCDHAIAIFEGILKAHEGKDFHTDLPLYLNAVLDEDERASLRMVDQASILSCLAAGLNDKALALAESGDPTSINYYLRAIAILEQLVNQGGRQVYARYLAAAYANTANVARSLSDWQGAIELYDKAISIYERLVFDESQGDSVEGLCAAYLDKAVVLNNVGRGYEGARLHESAISLLEKLAAEGTLRIRHTLCKAYVNHGAILAGLSLIHEALDLYAKAIELYEQLIAEGHQDTVLADFAWASLNRAVILYQVSDKAAALAELREVVPIIKKEAKRTGRADLSLLLDAVKTVVREDL
jgi:tetratricopeptide (TPR) repeat protein